MPDSIHALKATHGQRNNVHSAAFPPCHVDIATGERADYPLEFTRAVGGKVTLDRRRHTARAHIFGGSKVTRTHACTVLLDTGSPSTLIQTKEWERMLACGSASQNG